MVTQILWTKRHCCYDTSVVPIAIGVPFIVLMAYHQSSKSLHWFQVFLYHKLFFNRKGHKEGTEDRKVFALSLRTAWRPLRLKKTFKQRTAQLL
jgi:hypothetical protein